jgi:hypothetical protein
LKAAEWFRLVRLVMVSPDPRHHRRCQAANSTYRPVQIPRASSADLGMHAITCHPAYTAETRAHPRRRSVNKYVVGDLKNIGWLVWQGTLSYWLLVPLLVVSAWSFWVSRKDRRALLISFLPVCWLFPVLLAGAFSDWSAQEAKTASWVGGVGLAAVVVQIGWSIFAIVRGRGLRPLAIAGVIANGLIALPTWFVVAMDAAGDWI